jgi:ATP-dependent helicase/nuclease subunit A
MSRLTPSQQEAVKARGNVLVVAGAGTGKTHTLVERCLALLFDPKEPVSLENILMVTFTDAAAVEMRDRIRAALLQRQQQERDHREAAQRLAQQLALLDTAFISTLHSFCLVLVRQYFYALDLDPQVAVLDVPQTQPLIEQALDALLASCYTSTTPHAAAARDLIRSCGGTETALRDLILRVHRYTQSLVDPSGWYKAQVSHFERDEPEVWRAWLEQGFGEWRELWRPALAGVATEAENVGRILQALAAAGPPPVLPQVKDVLHRVLEEDQTTKWPKGMKGSLREPLKKFFDEAAFLHSVAPGPGGADPLAEDWRWTRPAMLSLLRLARDFGDLFAQAKREAGGVDFSDIEHLALRLLHLPATGSSPAIAQEWRERFHDVFVDECQDLNHVQDAILRAVSGTGNRANRFLVGDVKQSIYRFRLADPGIFQDYEQRWRRDASEGACLALSDNFRSREGILDFVNELFAELMRPQLGGLAYDAPARLQFGDPQGRAALRQTGGPEAAGGAAGPPVELHLVSVDEAGGEAEEGEGEAGEGGLARTQVLDLQTTELEARLVALRLRELKAGQHQVWDAAEARFRAVEWSDMVVLLRSARTRVECYAKEFSRLGVPLLAERGGFFDSAEILDLLSLLRLLDNPLQDVPLLAVLRSPLVGLSLDDLAGIRGEMNRGLFWAALNQWHQARRPPAESEAQSEPAALFDKVDFFLGGLKRWREVAREASLSECLEEILNDTSYEALLQTEARGHDRVANVRQLITLARRFDPYQRQGLFRFLSFVEAQEEAGVEVEAAPLPTRDAVRLMTTHKSKGLEFPVVVMAGLGTPFNFQDLQGRILLSRTYGLCPKVQAPDAEGLYPSLAHWLAARSERREALGEELRLFYVAMTRARDTLILVGSAASKAAGRRWAAGQTHPISDLELIRASRPLDWLRLWLPGITEEADWASETSGGNALLRWTIHPRDDPRFAVSGQAAGSANEPGVPLGSFGEVKPLRERLLWEYPWQAATLEPAKTSVSVLKRRALEDNEALLLGFARAESWPAPARGRSTGAAAGLGAAGRGSAHHLFLEQVRLDSVDSAVALKNEAARLVQSGFLSIEQEAALDYGALLRFWQSELGRRIRALPPVCLNRELPFTARFLPAEFAQAGAEPAVLSPPGGLEGEFAVVQGTVDLAAILPEAIWLVDFKTDRVRPEEVSHKVGFYLPQLRLYGMALERIYGRPVEERWLHFLQPGQSIKV